MKRGKKMFIIILSTLGLLALITWGAIAYLGRSQTLSIKSIENPTGDLYLIHITKPSHQKNQVIKTGKLGLMLSLHSLIRRPLLGKTKLRVSRPVDG